MCAAAVPLAGVLVAVHTVTGERAFGAVSLALAVAILALAVVSEHPRRRRPPPGWARPDPPVDSTPPAIYRQSG